MKISMQSRSTFFLPAKLTCPSIKSVLLRKRLFHTIKESWDNRIVWISGPAGSGKTTLAASFVKSRNGPCIWYQIDEGDGDPATFFYYLGLAVKYATPRNRKPLPLLTLEYLQGIHVFSKRFFEQISERLLLKTRRRSIDEAGNPVIVFDNYQEIPEDSQFQAVINAGIESIPEGINIVILSRNKPPAAFSRLRAEGRMHLIGWDEIRLTVDESHAIATILAGKAISEETLSRLYQTTDGWAAGMVLLMESLELDDVAFRLPLGLAKEEIFSYFASELLGRTTGKDRIFLMISSFLPDMNIPMATALTGDERAKEIFSDLIRKNYFTHRFVSDDQSFQYHPLFREFLHTKAAEFLSADHLRAIRIRAARLLEQNGRREDAVRLFCEAEQWDDGARVILNQASGMISQGRWQMLDQWLESLPTSTIRNQPWLLYWKGVCRFPASPEGSMPYYADAFERFRNEKDAAGSFLALSGMLDSVNFRLDTFVDLDRLIVMMDELIKEYGRFPSSEIESHVVNSMLNALTLRQPFNPTWTQWEQRGYALIRVIPNINVAIHILCGLAFYRLFSGEIEKVPPILDAIHQKTDTGRASTLALLSVRDMESLYYWLSSDFEKNRRAADEGIALAEYSGILFLKIYMMGHAAAGALSMGDMAAASGYLDSMHADIQLKPVRYGEYFYHILTAWKCMLEGRAVDAAVHADSGIEISASIGGLSIMANPHLIKAIVLHRLDDDEAANAHLSEIWNIIGKTSLFQMEFMACLLAAQMAFDRGDEAGGRNFLRRAMGLGKRHGYVNGIFWENAMVAHLCVKAIEHGIETDYVHHLIRRRRLVPKEPISHLENWPWPIKIYTLGKFEIMRDGESVQFSGKVQQRPLLLLKALIAFGGKNVREENLCDALWPDAEGDLAHRSFETTLYRLRQLLGKDNVLRLKESRLSLDMQSCWVDAFALDHLLTGAERLWETCRRSRADPKLSLETASKAIQLTQRAISLYQGHFLDAEPEQSWMFFLQDRLRVKFISGAESLAGYWESIGDMEAAVRCYTRALEIDDLAERFYQRLMILYKQMDRPTNALEVYARCRSVLDIKLGSRPSARTEAIRNEC